MKMLVDTPTLLADVRRNAKGLRAVRETVEDSGVGNIVVGKRELMDWEGEKQVKHNKAVANIIAKRLNVEPVAPNEADEAVIQADIVRRIEDALAKADETGRPQKVHVQEALRKGALDGAAAVVVDILGGGLGKVKKRTAIKKELMKKKGQATTKYGWPPPYGVVTGRFVESIEGEWKPSRRGRG